MSSVLSSIFFFLIALGLLIAIHEFGHYWVARRLGVKVLKFSIGFGKPLWKTTRGADNTEYALAAIPLGGNVRMQDEREGEVAPHELHRAINRQPAGMKAGDRVVAIDGEPVDDWEDWVAYVRAHPEQVIRTEVVRGGEHLVFI